jgi:replicative DNA helicase
MDYSLPDIHRSLPHSIEAEKGVIGSILIMPSVLNSCVEFGITKEHFHVHAHGIIFAELSRVAATGTPLDFITLTETLSHQGKLDVCGGPAYITDLFTYVPTAANAAYYMGIMRDKFILRQIIHRGTEIASLAYDSQDEIASVLSTVQQALFSIGKHSGTVERPTFQENVVEAINRLERAYDGTDTPALPWCFPGLNEKLGGLYDGEMILIQALRGGGKSSLAMQQVIHTARMGLDVLVFTFELPRLSYTNRCIAAIAKVNSESIRIPRRLAQKDWDNIGIAVKEMMDLPIHIEDNTGLDIEQVRALARIQKSKTPKLKLIVIDYLQKIRPTSKQGRSREQEVAEISDGIQKMAMELGLPVIPLSQVNDKGEARESRGIENDAKVMMSIKTPEWLSEDEENIFKERVARDIVINKNSNGSIGIVKAMFNKPHFLFEDRMDCDEPQPVAKPKVTREHPQSRHRRSND